MEDRPSRRRDASQPPHRSAGSSIRQATSTSPGSPGMPRRRDANRPRRRSTSGSASRRPGKGSPSVHSAALRWKDLFAKTDDTRHHLVASTPDDDVAQATSYSSRRSSSCWRHGRCRGMPPVSFAAACECSAYTRPRPSRRRPLRRRRRPPLHQLPAGRHRLGELQSVRWLVPLVCWGP